MSYKGRTYFRAEVFLYETEMVYLDERERVVVTGSPVRVIPSASMDKVVLLLLL